MKPLFVTESLFEYFTLNAEHYQELAQECSVHDALWQKGLSALFQDEAEHYQRQAKVSQEAWFLRLPRIVLNEVRHHQILSNVFTLTALEKAESSIRKLKQLKPFVAGEVDLFEFQCETDVDFKRIEKQIDRKTQLSILRDAFELIHADLQIIGLEAYRYAYSKGEDFVVTNRNVSIASGSPVTVKGSEKVHDKVHLSRVITGDLDALGYSREVSFRMMKSTL